MVAALLGCGDGFYADEARECQPCHADCKTCTGPRASECSTCPKHSCVKSICPVQIKPLLDHTTCVSACPHGTYANAEHVCTSFGGGQSVPRTRPVVPPAVWSSHVGPVRPDTRTAMALRRASCRF